MSAGDLGPKGPSEGEGLEAHDAKRPAESTAEAASVPATSASPARLDAPASSPAMPAMRPPSASITGEHTSSIEGFVAVPGFPSTAPAVTAEAAAEPSSRTTHIGVPPPASSPEIHVKPSPSSPELHAKEEPSPESPDLHAKAEPSPVSPEPHAEPESREPEPTPPESPEPEPTPSESPELHAEPVSPSSAEVHASAEAPAPPSAGADEEARVSALAARVDAAMADAPMTEGPPPAPPSGGRVSYEAVLSLLPPRPSESPSEVPIIDMPTSDDDPIVGRLIANKYRIDKLLGGGAMGSVYLATQVALDRPVAVKVMHPSLAKKADFAARFHREAKACSRLSHPNIVSVTDFGQEPCGLLYLVMEYVPGRTLDHVIHYEWPLEPQRTASIVSQVLSAMAVAHEGGIVHRDLKPENILVSKGVDDDGNPSDIVKVCDFGIAAIMGAGEVASRVDTARHQKPFKKESKRITIAGTVLGTPAYMSPEQGAGLAADARSDLYALGTVLYEMLTQRVPFEGPGAASVLAAHVLQEPTHPCEVVRSACPNLSAVALRALEKLPDDRFQTARSMRTAVRRSITHPGEPIAEVTPAHGTQIAEIPGIRPRVPSEPSASMIWNKSTETLAAPAEDGGLAPVDLTPQPQPRGFFRRPRLRRIDYGLAGIAAIALVLAVFFLWRRNDALASASATGSASSPNAATATEPARPALPPMPEAPAAPEQDGPKPTDGGPRPTESPKLVASKVATTRGAAFHPDHARLYPKVFATSRANRASVTDMVSRAELTSCYQDVLRRTNQSIGGRATAHLEIDAKGLVTSATVALPAPLVGARACLVHRLVGQRIAVSPDAPHANADVLFELEP